MSGPAHSKTSLPHMPALDGLRGIAVLGVLFFHSDAMLRGGYLGVDLFFVLSGYLITSLLVAEHAATGRIDLAAFWIRRARRLFPALLSLMPAIALYAWRFAKPIELAGLRADALATLGYVANWRSIFANKSYWEIFASPSPLEHTWSLAIEEQFYVVWPLLVVLVLVVLRRTPRALLALSIALTLASVALMLVLYAPSRTSRAYLGTDTRMAAILAGAALAIVMPPRAEDRARRSTTLDLLGFGAIAGLGVAWARLEGESSFLYRGGFWLTELGCLALIACAVRAPAGLVARALAFRPLAAVGLVSYGVYLWHWPVDVVLTPERVHVPTAALYAMRFAITFAIAIVSYRFYERPIRARGLPFGRAWYVVPAAVAASVLLVWRSTRARPIPSPISPPPPVAAAAPSEKRIPDRWSVDALTLPPASDLRPGTLRILSIGDSVSISVGLFLRYEQENQHAFVAHRGVGHCGVLSGLKTKTYTDPDEGNNCAKNWLKDVQELRPDVTLIVQGGGFFSEIQHQGRLQKPCDAGWRDVFRERMVSLFDEIAPYAGRVFVLTAAYPGPRWRHSDVMEQVDCFDKAVRESARLRSLTIIDLKSHTCPTKECILLSDGEPIRPDGLHYDGKGAEESARWVYGEIFRALGADAGATVVAR